MAKQDTGFTLIELMVTLAVAAILLAIGIPNMQTLMENSRVKNAANNVVSDLMFARSQAVNLGVEVIVCPLNDSKVCSSDWTYGLSIFIDANNNKILDSNENKIRIAEKLTTTDQLTFNNGNWINFAPDGMTNKNGTFSYCAKTQDPLGISLSQSGRARIDNDSAICN